MNENHLALIMAGGQGTRFWPWSTEQCPKQFLAVIGEETLFTQTYQRLGRFIKRENIFVVADAKYWPAIVNCVPDFAKNNFIAEPVPRNTAPCLMLANIALSRIQPEASLLVVPADHYIENEEAFARQLAAALVQADRHCIVTAGIRPDSPHTGYGYIQFDRHQFQETQGTKFFQVKQFHEKPDRETAQKYVQAGNFYWNSGMFIYSLHHFRDSLARYAPEYFEHYIALENAVDDSTRLHETFAAIRPDSIDYVLMEKTREASMLEAEFIWNDVGSWSSVYAMNQKDEQGNASRGQTVLLDTRDSLVLATDQRPLAVIGLKDIAVISTESGTLVCRREDVQRVREVITRLKKEHL